MPINPNYTEINVEEAMADPDSIYHFYKKLIAYRKGNEIIRNGLYKTNYTSSKDIFCYERWYEGKRLFVICNFKNKEVKFKVPSSCAYSHCNLEISNYKDSPETLQNMTLRPYESMVYLLV